MHLQVNGLNITLTDNLLDHVDKRFRFALDRLEPMVGRISVRLADANGPRGGFDKECKVLVTMRNGDTLVLHEKGEEMMNVIDRASDKTKRLINKKIDKKRTKRRKDAHAATGTNGLPGEEEEEENSEE
ncbi:MAG: HPF/RaiA family ribosome-associated protein [Candidatus Eisenbacteria bacterium]